MEAAEVKGSGALPKTSELVERIHACREEELARYEQLLELSRAQRTAIIEGDTESLVWATEEKGRLIQIIQTLDLRISGLIDDISILAGNESYVHKCRHPELGGGAACPLNTSIASVMKKILTAERENQALLEDAIVRVGDELRQLDSGSKAVRAYGKRSRGAPVGNVDDTF